MLLQLLLKVLSPTASTLSFIHVRAMTLMMTHVKAKMINGCLSVAAVQERRLDKAGLDPHRQAELQRDTVLLPEEGVPHAQICSEIIAR